MYTDGAAFVTVLLIGAGAVLAAGGLANAVVAARLALRHLKPDRQWVRYLPLAILLPSTVTPAGRPARRRLIRSAGALLGGLISTALALWWPDAAG